MAGVLRCVVAAIVAVALACARAAGARMVVWFGFNKETDWRLSVDPLVRRAARSTMAGAGWVTGGDYSLVRAALGI